MKFLARIRTDLQRSLAEQQRTAVLAVLRARLGELTFDDIHELVASPLGKGLGNVRVLDLLDGAAQPTGAAPPPLARPKSRPKKPVKAKKAKKAKQPKKATKTRESGMTLAEEVLRVLGTAKEPLRRGAIAEQIGVDPRALKHSLHLLVYDGSIVAEGPSNRRLYSLPKAHPAASVHSGEVSAADTAKPPPNENPKRSKRRKVSRKATKARRAKSSKTTTASQPNLRLSPQKLAELARYGTAVRDAIKAVGGWIGTADLRARVGGTPAQFRRAVKKLEVSGDIVRRGEKSRTQYAPAGTIH